MTGRSIAYITAPSEAEAKRIAKAIVEQRLAACANVSGPITSVYRWEGVVQEDPEWVVLFKTMESHQDALIKAVAELHPYDCPCVVFVAVSKGHQPFLDWIGAETGGV